MMMMIKQTNRRGNHAFSENRRSQWYWSYL